MSIATRKNDTAFIFFIFISACLVSIPMKLRHNHVRTELYTIINNPTFVGEVIAQELVRSTRDMQGWGFNEYRLHVVGTHQYDGETIYVNDFFTSYIYFIFHHSL